MCRPVSPRLICLGARSEALSARLWTSPISAPAPRSTCATAPHNLDTSTTTSVLSHRMEAQAGDRARIGAVAGRVSRIARATVFELGPVATSRPPRSCLCTAFTPSSRGALLLLVRCGSAASTEGDAWSSCESEVAGCVGCGTSAVLRGPKRRGRGGTSTSRGCDALRVRERAFLDVSPPASPLKEFQCRRPTAILRASAPPAAVDDGRPMASGLGRHGVGVGTEFHNRGRAT